MYPNRRSALHRAALALAAAIAAFGVAASPARAQCRGFSISQDSGIAIDPGSTDTGNHCDDCSTTIALPFPVTLYGVTYTSAKVISNGNIQFTTDNGEYNNDCLPRPATIGVAICPHWDDLRTDGAGEGIFTSVRGSAPSRIFNIEWRAHYYSGAGSANFQARLFEDNSRFEIVFGQVAQGAASATIGVQDTTFPPTQFSCNTAGLVSPGLRLTFACYNGPIGVGAASPNPVYACGSQGATLLSVAVTPGASPPSTGIAVTADLRSIGGPADQFFYDDASHGDQTPGNNVFSFAFTVPPITPPGDKSIPYTLSDAQGRSTQGVIGLSVNPCASTGPDVIVRDLVDANYYGTLGNVSAYALGTDACNVGDFPVLWIQGGTQHPMIAQNLYRLKNGRFEQIGQSFLKNSFQSLNSPGCGTCVQPPMGGAQLGVGCSDVYGAGYNGSQGNLSPRSSCNATTGVYPWPPPPAPSDVIGQRLQVFTADIDPALNAGALYFGEGHYVTADDAQWTHDGLPATNGLNNASYRRLTFASTTSAPTFVGPAQMTSPAIHAWKDSDPSVSLSVADYLDTSLPGPGIVCRFWVAAKATDNGDGTWHYEYAVQNINADRCAGGISVPIGSRAAVTNIGFHGVFAHSGEPFPNTASHPDPWTGAASANAVTWTTPEPYLPPRGDNANALRWGTLYNFRFDSRAAPVTGPVTIHLFKPGPVSSIDAPSLPVPGSAACAADINDDGAVTSQDFFDFLAGFFNQNADFNHDGITNSQDLFDFLAAFFAGC